MCQFSGSKTLHTVEAVLNSTDLSVVTTLFFSPTFNLIVYAEA